MCVWVRVWELNHPLYTFIIYAHDTSAFKLPGPPANMEFHSGVFRIWPKCLASLGVLVAPRNRLQHSFAPLPPPRFGNVNDIFPTAPNISIMCTWTFRGYGPFFTKTMPETHAKHIKSNWNITVIYIFGVTNEINLGHVWKSGINQHFFYLNVVLSI